MLVGDRMQREVVTIDREASLRRAWRVMENRRIRHLPVVEGRRLVGILTDRDIRQAAPSSRGNLGPRERVEFMDYLRVGQVMTRRIIAVTPLTSIGEAARCLTRHRIGCLPVVEERFLVGILTSTDLLGVLAEILREEGEGERVEVEVPDAPNALEALMRVGEAYRARILSLVNMTAEDGVAARALLRIEGDPDLFCAALAAAGFRGAFHPSAREDDALILAHLGRS